MKYLSLSFNDITIHEWKWLIRSNVNQLKRIHHEVDRIVCNKHTGTLWFTALAQSQGLLGAASEILRTHASRKEKEEIGSWDGVKWYVDDYCSIDEIRIILK